MTDEPGGVVVIGIGNDLRRDDGVGIVVAAALDALALANVAVKTGIADPMSLLEAWTGSGLTVIVDAAIADPSAPGRIRRCGLAEVATQPEGLSSHCLDIGRTYALGEVLGRVPGELVVFTVEVPDAGHGIGMTPPVAAAVPTVVDMVRAEVDRALRA